MSERTGLNRRLFWLYEGTGKASFWFRWALLVFDFVTIAYFLWAPFETRERGHYIADYVIGAVILCDLLARLYIAKHKHRFFLKWINWADLVVVVTMFAPLLVSNFAFLRVLRAVRAIRAFTFIRRVKVLTPFFQRHERIIDKVTNLFVFVFITAALVYALQVGQPESSVHTYIDALYFTVTSLTTTGYGDVILHGQLGRFIAILVMVLGLSLFLQLLRAIIEPESKVECECETCGLMRHDRDAVHCKHCGALIKIKTEGVL
ncbi:ion transporter [Henriciella aquimarina]|uniref:ion transporter n=1 Tax=Henriciella aquimarina TaxID=545261 RepID=UPI0009FF7EA7|nr:ion transporter [Henriciella aquimarina]